ncbi:MAG TPA: hypothetical protein VJ949_13415, partial [Cryomorphaceae bacterium]|nr:hypothetical protein [Cryomorphaceae bacterium]
MEENNLDNYFKEKLDGHTEEPSPDVWEGIESKLPKGGFVWNKRYFLLLLLLVSIGGGGYLGYRLDQVDSKVAELESQIQNQTSGASTEMNGSSGITKEEEEVQVRKKLADEKKTTSSTKYEESEFDESVIASANEILVPQSNMSTNKKPTLNSMPASKREKDQTSSNNFSTKTIATRLSLESTESDQSITDLVNSNDGAQQDDSDSPLVLNEGETKSKRRKLPVFNPMNLQDIEPVMQVNPEFTTAKRETDYFGEKDKDWYLYVYGMASYTHRRVVAIAEGSEALPARLDKVENGLITPGAGLQV